MEQTELSVTEGKGISNSRKIYKSRQKCFEKTKHLMNKVLDFANEIDRWFYLHGGTLKWFIWLSFGVVVIAPFIDWLRNDWQDKLTYWTTAFLFIFLFIMLLAWIDSLRDDEGNWSFHRIWSRIWTNLQINYDFIMDSISKPRDEMLYRFSQIFIIGSFCCKALQNVSVFFRKSLKMEFFFGRLEWFRSVERTINTWAILIFLLGLILLVILCYINKKIRKTFIQNYLPFFTSNNSIKLENTPIQISSSNLVINTKDTEQINTILKMKNPEFYNEFILALQIWNPRSCYSEYDFENKLERHLKRNIQNSSVKRQHRLIVDPKNKQKDKRPDIIINDTILIELKKDNVCAASKTAFNQVFDYSSLWIDKGLVILLFCEGSFEKVKAEYVPRLNLLEKDNKKVVVFVAKPI